MLSPLTATTPPSPPTSRVRSAWRGRPSIGAESGPAIHWTAVLALIVLGLSLLGTSAWLGARVVSQNDTLRDRVSATGRLVDANIRTPSQASRELLRLKFLIATSAGPGQLRLEDAFVTQRTHEAALPIQINTLG